jgi:hypothetical protein
VVGRRVEQVAHDLNHPCGRKPTAWVTSLGLV